MLRWRNLTWKHLFILLLVIAPCSVMGFHLFPVSRWAQPYLQCFNPQRVPQTRKLQTARCLQAEYHNLSQLDFASDDGIIASHLPTYHRGENSTHARSWTRADLIFLFSRRRPQTWISIRLAWLSVFLQLSSFYGLL